MYQGFKDLLSAFHAQSVKYLIVGGYAVSFHGQPCATKDIDLFIKADPANGLAVYKVLAAPQAIDILPGIDGVDSGSGVSKASSMWPVVSKHSSFPKTT